MTSTVTGDYFFRIRIIKYRIRIFSCGNLAEDGVCFQIKYSYRVQPSIAGITFSEFRDKRDSVHAGGIWNNAQRVSGGFIEYIHLGAVRYVQPVIIYGNIIPAPGTFYAECFGKFVSAGRLPKGPVQKKKGTH